MALSKPTSCSGCPLYTGEYGTKSGFVPASGTGDNGVLIVLEAAGKDEASTGVPLAGATGQYFFTQLKRVGIEREGFRIHNVLSCQPPNNKLIKQPYTEAAIAHCYPNLEETILSHVEYCKKVGKTPTILALGKFSARRVLGWQEWSPEIKQDYYAYPIWSQKYGAWVICAPHPSFIMQGNHAYVDLLLYCAQRALSIASDGIVIEEPTYLLDPEPLEFHKWVRGYMEEKEKNPETTFLSYDIETPYKKGKSEEKMGKEDEGLADESRIILRCSFCYKPGNAVSVPWNSEYMTDIERLFTCSGLGLNWNGETYDNTRIIDYIPSFNLVSLDGMLGWHALQSSLPKSLGFVTPFFWQNTGMWKHLSDEKPAFYNAKDADAALRNWLGILPNLEAYGLKPVFDRHILELNKVLRYMTSAGVMQDKEARAAAETRLTLLQDSFKARMVEVVPQEARSYKIYKKEPKGDKSKFVQVRGTRTTKKCPNCGSIDIKAPHFKSIGKKKLQSGQPENPCVGLVPTKVPIEDSLYALPLEFKLSIKSLSKYQSVLKHKPILTKKDKKVTFDESAIKTLKKNYPKDPLYSIIVDYREVQTTLSRYVGRTQEDGRIKGGMPVGPDGRVHCLYSHNPSTLRLASQNPNMQNLTRPDPKNPDAIGNIVRNLIVAEPGWTLGARDFSGIEAVLVGYEAKAKDYVRLAWRDVHSFYTAYALYEVEGRISANDLPSLEWDDDKLFSRLADIKSEFKKDRNNLYKHLVHAINFGQGAYGARDKIYEETGILYDTKLISRVMDIYKELFPKIGEWHKEVRREADDQGYLKNAFGYVHRFNHVYSWKVDRYSGQWVQGPGDDAEAVLAFRPQSTAAGIIKEAMLRLYFERFQEAGQWMRLTTHDEILWHCPQELQPSVDKVFVEEMEKPIPELPLPPEWGYGPHLWVLTEGKEGSKWGSME